MVYGYFLLIIPMTIGGVLLQRRLDEIVYLYFGISMVLAMRKFVLTLLKLRKYKTEMQYTKFQKWSYYLIIFNIIGFLIISISIPERGWDALNIYLPNGLYFFLRDQIVAGINPFSFFPTFKPPLNTLLITYSYYVAKGMYANLHPFVFLLGSVAVTYEISILLTENKTIAFISSLILLTLPFTFFLIIEFAFYQELPLLFFGSACFYYVLQLSKKPPTHPNYNLFKLGFILSFSLATLSKISGFAIIFLVFLTLDYSEKAKRIQKISLVLVSLYLIQKASYDVYIGYGIVILLISSVLYLSIDKKTSGIKLDIPDLMKLSLLPVILGIGWIIFSLQIPEIGQFLIRRYVYSGKSHLSFVFPTIPSTMVHAENGLRVSFFVSIFYVLIGSSFGPNLLFFKLDGFRRIQKHQFLLRWFLGYLIIFFGYFGNISARYLVPIMVPLSVIIGISIYYFLERFHLHDKGKFLIFCFILFTSYFFYAPIFPIYILRDNIALIFYNYHAHILSVFVYLTLLTILMVKLPNLRFIRTNFNINLLRFFFILALLPTIVLPIGFSAYAYSHNTDPGQLASYSHPPNYQNTIKYIQGLQLKLEDLIMTINMPGLGYYLSHQVLDLYLIRSQSEININFQKMTLNQASKLFIQLKAKMLIVENTTHYFYKDYIRQYSNLSIVKITQTPAFQLTYFNPEFRVFYLVNASALP